LRVLRAITLDGFRCFAEPTRVTFGALTVLAGANSAGKSSVIHALLLLMQSEQQPSEGHLRLSGEWVEIGGFRQALNYSRQGEQRWFTIGLSGEIDGVETDVLLALGEPEESFGDAAKIERIEACAGDMELAFDRSSGGRGSPYGRRIKNSNSSVWEDAGGVAGFAYPWTLSPRKAPNREPDVDRLIPFGPESALYMSAFRDLPRKFYPRRRSELGPVLGAMGEYVAETLFMQRNATTNILPEAGRPLSLGEALEAWWAHIFGDDYGIRAEAADDLGFTLSLDTPSAENLRLTQVGTGLSQVLPVVVLGLCSKPGDLVIVESPEVQLHPAAQHRLMDLFVALARSGRQVILETHSDHIVHATQLAVKHQKLPSEDVAMRFFSQEQGVARVEQVPVDEHGRMQKQPIGFVDQASTDLLDLIR
jgi:predicted ATPase